MMKFKLDQMYANFVGSTDATIKSRNVTFYAKTESHVYRPRPEVCFVLRIGRLEANIISDTNSFTQKHTQMTYRGCILRAT